MVKPNFAIPGPFDRNSRDHSRSAPSRASQARVGKREIQSYRGLRAMNLLLDALVKNRIESLPITDLHALRAGQLPRHHRDPFDRMLIAQAQVESLALLSNDPQCSRYELRVIW
ncbi:MAG: type II toxin-antitoxin system VapC family toxin [Pseudomonadota bacterium]